MIPPAGGLLTEKPSPHPDWNSIRRCSSRIRHAVKNEPSKRCWHKKNSLKTGAAVDQTAILPRVGIRRNQGTITIILIMPRCRQMDQTTLELRRETRKL